MAAGATVVTDGDGAVSLVATVDGVLVTFATVNASQIHEARAQQAANPPAKKVTASTAKTKE